MAAVLGVSANYHDAAAALVIDGAIVAAIQEERLSRVKNDPSLPLRAIAACLAPAQITVEELDAVVFYENPYAKFERVLSSALRSFPRALSAFPRAMASQLGGKLWVLDALANRLGIAREKIEFREHHLSHAASAFLCSPFARAAVLTVDGVGEHASTAIFRGDGSTLTQLESIEFPHSLGLLYAAITAYLGFEVNEGEAKVMGLAAFGQARLREAFAKLLIAERGGRFRLGLAYFDEHADKELGFGKRLEQLLGPRRPLGKPWRLREDARDRHYADVAATLQAVTEDALRALAARARELAGCEALCMAGGVALNAVANARISQHGPLFVQPAAGDAGAALGAALLGACARGDPRPPELTSTALGTAVDAGEAHALATQLGLHVTRVSDPITAAASALERGALLGFVCGRFEFGPRALGQRSLLAPVQPADVRERLNRVVKRREPFRPFAPAVLSARASEYFGAHAETLARFMLTVAEVLPAQRAQLSAVTHEDGSARVQVVAESSALGALLRRLASEQGLPLVLNTSLNANGEPIVAGASDALHFMLLQRIDAMLIEDVLIERSLG